MLCRLIQEFFSAPLCRGETFLYKKPSRAERNLYQHKAEEKLPRLRFYCGWRRRARWVSTDQKSSAGWACSFGWQDGDRCSTWPPSTEGTVFFLKTLCCRFLNASLYSLSLTATQLWLMPDITNSVMWIWPGRGFNCKRQHYQYCDLSLCRWCHSQCEWHHCAGLHPCSGCEDLPIHPNRLHGRSVFMSWVPAALWPWWPQH